MMNIFKFPKKIVFIIILVLVNIILSSVLVTAQTNSQEEELPAAPDTGTPTGESTPGGSRPNAKCPKTKLPLRALVANNGKDFTVSEYPNFLFNVPYSDNQISNIEFALKDPEELTTVYRTAIKLTGKPGIVKISIPQESKYALKSNKDYRWNLILYCVGNKTDEPEQYLTGWIRRVTVTPQLKNGEYQSYLKNNIFYDGISLLAEKYFANPDDKGLKTAWNDLSESLKWDKLDENGFAEIVLTEPVE